MSLGNYLFKSKSQKVKCDFLWEQDKKGFCGDITWRGIRFFCRHVVNLQRRS